MQTVMQSPTLAEQLPQVTLKPVGPPLEWNEATRSNARTRLNAYFAKQISAAINKKKSQIKYDDSDDES